MYNEEIKRQYIQESLSRNLSIETYLSSKFNATEKFEEMYGIDLCEFHIDQIMEFYKSLCTTSFNTMLVINSQFAMYGKWCNERNLIKDHQNHFDEVTSEMIMSCMNKSLLSAKIISREELISSLDNLENISDRVAALGLFEGLTYDDLAALDVGDLSDSCVIKLKSERELKVSKEFIDMARKSAYIFDVGYDYQMNDDGRKKRRLNYKETDTRPIKDLENSVKEDEESRRRRIYSRIMRARELTSYPFFDNVALRESGRIEMILGLAEKDKITPDECIRKYRTEIEYRYGKIQSIVQYVNRYFPED